MSIDSGNVLLLSIIAAVVPATLYLAIIYWFDRYEKEPLWLLGALFLWGAVPAILLAIFLSVVASAPLNLFIGPDTLDTVGAILLAPPIEESVKGLALLGLFWLAHHEIDSLLDGIIYGAMVGMGFALVENVFYFVNIFEESGAQDWGSLVLLRAVVFGLNHSLFTSMTGLGIAVSRFARTPRVKILAPILGWLVAVAFHTVHNLGAALGTPYCLLLPLADWGGVWLMIAIIIWALVQERNWIRTYLEEEVALGLLTPEQYRIACSSRARLLHRLELLLSRGPRAYLNATHFYRHCSELAYKKHHFELLQEDHVDQMTEELRVTLARLSHDM
jgi:RsiW-degrading membrane proteinase PrsW (M82 family)